MFCYYMYVRLLYSSNSFLEEVIGSKYVTIVPVCSELTDPFCAGYRYIDLELLSLLLGTSDSFVR